MSMEMTMEILNPIMGTLNALVMFKYLDDVNMEECLYYSSSGLYKYNDLISNRCIHTCNTLVDILEIKWEPHCTDVITNSIIKIFSRTASGPGHAFIWLNGYIMDTYVGKKIKTFEVRKNVHIPFLIKEIQSKNRKGSMDMKEIWLKITGVEEENLDSEYDIEIYPITGYSLNLTKNILRLCKECKGLLKTSEKHRSDEYTEMLYQDKKDLDLVSSAGLTIDSIADRFSP